MAYARGNDEALDLSMSNQAVDGPLDLTMKGKNRVRMEQTSRQAGKRQTIQSDLQSTPLDLSLPSRKRAYNAGNSSAPQSENQANKRMKKDVSKVTRVRTIGADKSKITGRDAGQSDGGFRVGRNRQGVNSAANVNRTGGASTSTSRQGNVNERANSSEKPYVITQTHATRTWKKSVEEKTYEVKFDEKSAGTKLIDIRDSLVEMFDDIVTMASQNYSRSDKAQLTINHGGMREELFIHLQDLSNISGSSIMDRFEKVLNSNEEMKVDESFQVHVGLVRPTKGGGPNGKDGKRSGRALPLHPHLNHTIHSSIINKKSIVEITCEKELICAAKSIVVCMAKMNNVRGHKFENLIKKSRQSSKGKQSLRSQALRLQRQTGLPTTSPVRVDQLALFENVLNVKIAVIQFLDASDEPCITQCSNRKMVNDRIIFLYFTDNHFHAVVNHHAMFPNHRICMDCLKPYNSRSKSHPCLPKTCFVCNRENCEPGKVVRCTDCNFTCLSKSCYDAHKEQPVSAKGSPHGTPKCKTFKKCLSCGKVIFLKKQKFEDHVCGQYHCRLCDSFVEQDHLCYLRRKAPKSSSGKFIFFDFETMQDGVFQCEDGYSPPPPNTSCKVCTSEHTCLKCRMCVSCRSSNCGRQVHQPNLVVSQSACDMCKNEPMSPRAKCVMCGDVCKDCEVWRKGQENLSEWECEAPNCGLREKVFKGLDTVYKFCSWLISPLHKNFNIIAHNGKGFDFMFILQFCVSEAKIRPDCIYAGSKIMSMQIKENLNIKFIDSLNFMGMALKKLPKAFGLTPENEINGNLAELQKGDFPHFMNTRENQNYIGPFPPLNMYSLNNMGSAERIKFEQWHAEQKDKIFNLQEEMLSYCRVDVVILRLACMRFRDLFLEITTKTDDNGDVTGFVDPFYHITIASACMANYRVNFITEKYEIELSDGRSGIGVFKSGMWWMDGEKLASEDIISKKFVSSCIAQVPAQGYVRNSNHSHKSIAWIEWVSRKLGREIRHARNRGEKVIHCGNKRYSVDGYDEATKTIYEFHGCRFHGCPICFTDRKTKDPRTGFSMKDLHEMTKKRSAALRVAGFVVNEIYECQFDKMVKNDAELSNFIKKELDVPQRMGIRSAFYGGRTSCFSLHHECDEGKGEEIHYADVCSLYPFINKTAKMPVGHPEIITRDFDMTMQSYFGIAHVKVLPPKHEYVPCLPVRINGKLTFPLCRVCAESENHDDCHHSDEERMISGVWCTPEILASLSQGFKIIKIYEVLHYPETSQFDPDTGEGGLFSEQVDLFMKIKTEASGFPEWVKSESDKDLFINQIEEKVGIKLEKSEICANPALRSIAKICLNSFWGKLGEKNNKMKTKFISTTEEFDKLQHNSSNVIHRLHIVNEDVMVVEFKNVDEFEEESWTTNEVIAAFTTCFARLELLKHINSVGRNILYCDTDSIIFLTHKKQDKDGGVYYDTYPELGDSLGELTNELPPGVFINHFVTTAPKSYSYRCSDESEICKFKGVTLNFRNSKRINFEAVRDLLFGRTNSITLEPQTNFTRSKYDGIIYNTELVKTVKPTFNKRRILPNFDTVPFGYVFP